MNNYTSIYNLSEKYSNELKLQLTQKYPDMLWSYLTLSEPYRTSRWVGTVSLNSMLYENSSMTTKRIRSPYKCYKRSRLNNLDLNFNCSYNMGSLWDSPEFQNINTAEDSIHEILTLKSLMTHRGYDYPIYEIYTVDNNNRVIALLDNTNMLYISDLFFRMPSMYENGEIIKNKYYEYIYEVCDHVMDLVINDNQPKSLNV